MNLIKIIFNQYHEKWAKQRLTFFLNKMDLKEHETIMDLGGSSGSYMDLLASTKRDFNIIITDLNENALKIARSKGYNTKIIDGSGKLPFEDNEIDCVFCNSVIEHITIPKAALWSELSYSSNFSEESYKNQKYFASEIRRCSKKYYVQTPHIDFPIEAHTWFPFISYFSRRRQLNIIALLNKYWVKKTQPDWNLLSEKDFKLFFPDADIIVNKKFGFKKEIIAIKK